MTKLEENLLKLQEKSVQDFEKSIPDYIQVLQKLQGDDAAQLSKKEVKEREAAAKQSIVLLQQRLSNASKLIQEKFHLSSKIGHIDEIIHQIEKAPLIKIDPEKTLQETLGFDNQLLEDFYSYAADLFHEKKIEEASDLFFFLTTLNAYVPSFWQALATAEEMLGRQESAVSCYGMLILLDPKNFSPALNIAQGLAKLGKHQEALSFLHKMIDAAKLEKQEHLFIQKAQKLLKEI
jgi:tetratricopeptide (TPR) repeat protein